MTAGASHFPSLSELEARLRQGLLSRREFLAYAALITASAASVTARAGASMAAYENNLPFPPSDPHAKRGGTLRVGQMVGRMIDPATYSWNEMANQTRPILDYLTMLGPDNIVRPMLLEAWQPSTDLKTWVLNVRPGVMWHNGEELTAEHVAWNIRRWSDPGLGSSNLGLSTFAALTESHGAPDARGRLGRRAIPGAVEVLDSHTVRLNLGQAVLSVPEDCAEYCTLVVHPSFKAPFWKNPIGTGPYTLASLRVAERCILKRVTHTTEGKPFRYWGGDVYLDEIHFYNIEQDNQTAAVASGSIDVTYELTVDQLELAQSLPDVKIASVDTAQTLCLRMQVDAKPFDDVRVRRAIVKAADNAALKNLVFGEHGSVAHNYHVAPIHPEYFPLPVSARDVAGARQLLKDAGYPTGIDLTVTVGNNDGPWHQSVAEALRDQLRDAGIRLAVEVIPATKYWEVWKTLPFSATSWAHRPLGTMALAQAYRSGASWNETHFSSPEFDRALADAEATFDVAQRRRKMQAVESILAEAAIMVQSLWRPYFILTTSRVNGYQPHPARQMHLTKVWIS